MLSPSLPPKTVLSRKHLFRKINIQIDSPTLGKNVVQFLGSSGGGGGGVGYQFCQSPESESQLRNLLGGTESRWGST